MSDATHTLRLSRNFKVPRSLVFDAFTQVDQVTKWWGPKGFTTPEAEMDVRVGGKYRFGMQSPDGNVMHVRGEYQVIDAPNKIAFTWAWEEGDMADIETLVTIELLDRGGSTEVVLTHERFRDETAKRLHGEGWTSSLDCLGEAVEN